MKPRTQIIIASASVLLAIVVYAAPLLMPTTWPATVKDPASAAIGWTLRDALDNPPATQPTTAPTTGPTTNPTTNPALAVDIAPFIATMKAGVKTTLPPGSYFAKGTFVIPASATLDATGCSINYTETAGTVTLFHLTGASAGIINFSSVSGTGVFVTADAPGWNVSGNHFVKVDRAVQFNDAAANGIFTGNSSVMAGSMLVYGSADNPTITYNDFGQSMGEAVLRIDVKAKKRPNGQWDRPVKGLIAYNKIVSHNAFRKPAFELRSADGFVIQFNSGSNFQIGQLPTTAEPNYPIGSAVTGVTINGNTFDDPDAGVNPVYIRQGVSGAIVNGNIFGPTVATLGLPPISVDVNSFVTTSGNTQYRPAGMPTIKPLVAASQQVRWKGDGTDKVVADPTTQPAK